MTDGFLGRWSKRKLEVKEGKAVAEPTQVEAKPPSPQPSPASGRGGEDKLTSKGQGALASGSQDTAASGGRAELTAVEEGDSVPAPSPPKGEGRSEGTPAELPPLTLDDVKALTLDSDFSRFTAANVAPEVKNAALKKLFTDPHYNVMDGLDVYIDDYSQPDPIPQAMLRQLTGAKFLGLFDQEEKQEAEAEAARRSRDVADNPTVQSVAQSEAIPLAVPEPAPEPEPEPESSAVPEPPDHADPDLRLQQDHAAPGEDPGRGTQ
jgi:hypothetical protein